MPIKKESLAAIEKAFNMKEGQFKEFWESKDEVEIKIDSLEIIPKTDYETRIGNIKTESKAEGFKEGKTEGEAIIFREVTKALNLGIDTKKVLPVAEFATTIKTKVLDEAKVPIEQKTKEWEADKSALTQRAETAEKKIEELKNDWKKKERSQQIHTALSSAIPKDTILPSDEATEIVIKRAKNAGIVFDIDETTGAVIGKKGTEIIKDVNRNFEKPDVILKPFFEGIVKPVTGGGADKSGGDGGGGGAGKSSLEAFTEEMEKKGIKSGSREFVEEMNARYKAKTLTL